MVFGRRKKEHIVEESSDSSDDVSPKVIHSQRIQATKKVTTHEPQNDATKPKSKSKRLLYELVHLGQS